MKNNLLRDQTRHQHRQIDESRIVKKLLSPNCQLSDVDRFLKALFEFYAPYEQAYLKFQKYEKTALSEICYPTFLMREKFGKVDTDAYSQIFQLERSEFLALSYLILGSQKGNLLMLKKWEEHDNFEVPSFFKRRWSPESWELLLENIKQEGSEGVTKVSKILFEKLHRVLMEHSQ